MKRTTVSLDERLLARIKAKARREGRTFQECAAELMQRGLLAETTRPTLPPLPCFELGPALIDVADHEVLLDLLDQA